MEEVAGAVVSPAGLPFYLRGIRARVPVVESPLLVVLAPLLEGLLLVPVLLVPVLLAWVAGLGCWLGLLAWVAGQ